MVRYTQRKWFTPIGFMSQSATSFPVLVFLLGGLFAYPLRYRIADYWERCSQDPGDTLRAKAIIYYMELETVGQRQAYLLGPGRSDSSILSNNDFRMVSEEIQKGTPAFDEEYFRLHYLDGLRVQKMQEEIEELKKQMALEKSKK